MDQKQMERWLLAFIYLRCTDKDGIWATWTPEVVRDMCPTCPSTLSAEAFAGLAEAGYLAPEKDWNDPYLGRIEGKPGHYVLTRAGRNEAANLLAQAASRNLP